MIDPDDLATVQSSLRIAVAVLSLLAIGMTLDWMRTVARERLSPRRGLGISVCLILFGQLWFQVGFVLWGVPDTFHMWSCSALAGLTVGTGSYSLALFLSRGERKALGL